MENTEVKVASELVVDELRMGFLPLVFGRRYLQGEGFLYDWASRLSPDYSGGHWLFFRLSNGGFFAAPSLPLSVNVRCNLNGYEGQMGNEAFGIVVTLYALCHLAEVYDEGMYIDHYHALRAYAHDHPERREIFRAID